MVYITFQSILMVCTDWDDTVSAVFQVGWWQAQMNVKLPPYVRKCGQDKNAEG